MAEKIRLGVISDFAAPSGFAAVSQQIVNYLDNTDKYEIFVLGINYHGAPNDWAKRFNVWPAKLGGDYLGVGFTKTFIRDIKPNVVFLFQDFWNLPLYIGQMEAHQHGVVCYYPVDARNIKGQYMMALAAAQKLVCYTHFGVEESTRAAEEAWDIVKVTANKNKVSVAEQITAGIGTMAGIDNVGQTEVPISVYQLKSMKDASYYDVIPHGVDITNFYPTDKKAAREYFNLPKDAFIIGNVNRNQSRKRQDISIAAFSEFAKDKDNTYLLLHCVRNDPKGWDLAQLSYYYGVADKVIFTHELFPGKEATLETLNFIYNTLDVQINTGGGEGWGLTSVEGAACMVPQIVPDWSATKEIWEGNGLLLNVVGFRHEPSSINTKQAVCDHKHCAELLSELYEDEGKRIAVGEACYYVTQRPEYSWEAIGAAFDKLFTAAADKKPEIKPVAFNAEGVLELKKRGIIV